MFQCQYCGRYFKSAYSHCPGCSSDGLRLVNDTGVMKIINVPQGGYKINFSNVKINHIMGIFFTIIGIFWIISSVFALFLYEIVANMIVINETGESFFGSSIVFLIEIPSVILGLVILFLGIKFNKKNKRKIEKLKRLTQFGVLIKNLPYELKNIGTINGRPVYRIEVMYELDNGTELQLISEEKYFGEQSYEDKTVDLLIDSNDYSNYYIDFEIY